MIASPCSHGGLYLVKCLLEIQQRARNLEGSWCVGDNFLTQLMSKLMGCLQAILGTAIMKWEFSILRKLWRGVTRKATLDIWTDTGLIRLRESCQRQS